MQHMKLNQIRLKRLKFFQKNLCCSYRPKSTFICEPCIKSVSIIVYFLPDPNCWDRFCGITTPTPSYDALISMTNQDAMDPMLLYQALPDHKTQNSA